MEQDQYENDHLAAVDQAAVNITPAVDADDVESIDVVAAQSTEDPQPVSEDELKDFEQRIDDILATGELDETLRFVDENGVAQVLPVLDTEPISHLLEGIEEIGGRANVFVRTRDGIAVLNVMEYSPDDPSSADETPTGETPVITETTTTVTDEEAADPER